MRIIKKIKDSISLKCSSCGKRIFLSSDHSKDLINLKNLGEYTGKHIPFEHLCDRCWRIISVIPCDLCNKNFWVTTNSRTKLINNLYLNGQNEEPFYNKKRICNSCYKKNSFEKCQRCEAAYKIGDNSAIKYMQNNNIKQYLYPYHPEYRQTWEKLCPTCYNYYKNLSENIYNLQSKWLGGTKEEHLYGFRTINTFENIEYTGTNCKTPDELEKYLMLYSIQCGANAYIKFSWNRHEVNNFKSVLKRSDLKGNLFNKKHSWKEIYFTGYAKPVIVEEIYQESKAKPKFENLKLSTRPQISGNQVGVKQNNFPAITESSSPIDLMSKTKILGIKSYIIDGSNVFFWRGSYGIPPDIKIVISLCYEFFKQKIPFFIFFDASAPFLLGLRTNSAQYKFYMKFLLALPNNITEVPGKTCADDYILQKADLDNAHIISGDQYKPYVEKFHWLSNDDRLLRGKVAANRIMIPKLGLDLNVLDDIPMCIEYFKRTDFQIQESKISNTV